MKKYLLMACLLVVSLAANAQFEKGKWIVNPSVSGLSFSHNTETDRTTFGINASGGVFLLDDVALMVNAGAEWNARGTKADVYSIGVGARYYFEKIGLYGGANVNLDKWNWGGDSSTRASFGLEAGYAFFLSRTITIEPAAFWDFNNDFSNFGLKVGFGFYF